jgi:hypothetical protein
MRITCDVHEEEPLGGLGGDGGARARGLACPELDRVAWKLWLSEQGHL